tara:strand:- start:19820 stop:20770 length:951 start_codon:yes stop_codon:yes gene_type:complete
MKYKKIAIFGGSGFVGRHLTHQLHALGYQVRVFTRHAQRHSSLKVSAEIRECDPYDTIKVSQLLDGCDAVINLIGILNPKSRKQSFKRVHIDLTEKIVEACHNSNVERILHMSALQADQETGTSEYLRTKGKGENRVHKLSQPNIAVTSFRPSVIFGPDDSFLNRFSQLLKIPGPMPLACHDSRFAPIAIQDVVQAFCLSLENRQTFGKRYELCGPEEFTLEQIVRLVAFHTGRDKEIIKLSDRLSRLQAYMLQYLPGKPFTPDNYLSLKTASICSHSGLEELGIYPTSMTDSISQILGDESKAKKLNKLRRSSGR